MKTNRGIAALVVAASFASCGDPGGHGPPPCRPIGASVAIGTADLSSLPADTVLGFADLHAHPAIERAFAGRLVWGSANDDAPVDAAALPRIDACPVETHDPRPTTPLDRAVGGEVFPKLAIASGFAHAPVGHTSYRPTPAWPNARDLIHQQMNVSSIRRAYEGGLRLMFASTTDDQVLSALLTGPNDDGAFVPDPGADYASAVRQLAQIQALAVANADWMGIATDPDGARDLINQGKLALVLSLEMEGLRCQDIDRLREDFGVRHVVPIHLVDNDIGGTATAGDIFNLASAAVSDSYGLGQARYMQVASSARYGRALGWPIELGTMHPPLYIQPSPVPFSWYEGLCYEPFAACQASAPTHTSFLELGQENARGLGHDPHPDESAADCSTAQGAGRMRHMMGQKMLLDLSHMGRRAAKETLALDSTYPFISSHTDVAHLCEGQGADCCDGARAPTTERALEADAARDLLQRGGVLGTSVGINNYEVRPLVVARGGPLFSLWPGGGSVTACATRDGDGCQPALVTDRIGLDQKVDRLVITTRGGVSGAAPRVYPYVRVELRGDAPEQRYRRHVIEAPLACSPLGCTATIDLAQSLAFGVPSSNVCQATSCGEGCDDGPHVVGDIDSISLEWLYFSCDYDCQAELGNDRATRQCANTWDGNGAPQWAFAQAEARAFGPQLGGLVLAELGPRSDSPVATLQGSRGKISLYSHADRNDAADDVVADGRLLKVSLHSSPGSPVLEGASATAPGANVCVAVRHQENGRCVALSPPAPDATECPSGAGWAALNQRGAWADDTTLITFVRSPWAEPDICGVDVFLLDWHGDSRFDIDEARIEAMQDPVDHFVRRYIEISKYVAKGSAGALAIGTDFNGFNGMLEISEDPVRDGALAASACPAAGVSGVPLDRAPITPMRFRNKEDATLEGEVRIDERGLATYGLLEDLLAVVAQHPCGKDVHDSLMLSAERTLRAWELLVYSRTCTGRRGDRECLHQGALPILDFTCAAPPGYCKK